MSPTLVAGQIVIATRHKKIRAGDVVVIAHDGLEKIKRVELVSKNGYVYVTGDNSGESTDSRSFGWLSESAVLGRLVWPRNLKR